MCVALWGKLCGLDSFGVGAGLWWPQLPRRRVPRKTRECVKQKVIGVTSVASKFQLTDKNF